MTLSTEKQIITKHRKPNISRIKGNHTMKFGQLIRYNMKKLFFKDHAKNERLVPNILLFFKKAYMR